MQKTCFNSWCCQPFEVTDDDRDLLDRLAPIIAGQKIPIPDPTLCPPCRSQRRLAWRNERILYRRSDSMTGKEIISVHASEKSYPVVEPDVWYSDRWDAMDYGITFNRSRSFFGQMQVLQQRVPRMSLGVIKNENCPYVNQIWNCKDCHLCFDMGFCQDVLYSTAVYHSQDLTDCSFTRESTLSYGLIDCSKCYRCIGLCDCSDCSDSFFSADCAQCRNIAFCTNLRGKQYCFRNEQMTKEEWMKALSDMRMDMASCMQRHVREFLEIFPSTLRRATHNILCEDCTGDYLLHSRKCRSCFDCDKSEDLAYCNRLDEQVFTAMDIDHASLGEVMYEGVAVAGHGIFFCHASYSPANSNLLYCDFMVASSDCFGCVGLKNKKYCILNRQYSKEEYEDLVPEIVARMRSDGEWGEYFPAARSIFAYNESAAQQFFPLTRAEVLHHGWNWRNEVDEIPKVDRIIPATQLQDSIDDVSDDILNWAIECEVSKRPFRVIKQELDFYRQMRLPIPRLHPDERHRRRMALRNPRKLWKRKCAMCGEGIETSYSPDRPEKVLCEECYLKEVY
jgi:hypothetical protein